MYLQKTVLKFSLNTLLLILVPKVSLPRHFLCACMYMYAFHKLTRRIPSYFRLSRSRSCPERPNSPNLVRHIELGCCTWLNSCCSLVLLQAGRRPGCAGSVPWTCMRFIPAPACRWQRCSDNRVFSKLKKTEALAMGGRDIAPVVRGA